MFQPTPLPSMFIPRVLKNPPIREAIFTITFKDPVAPEKLNEFLNTPFVKSKFPAAVPGYKINITHTQKPTLQASTSDDGFSLKQAGDINKRLIQVKSTYLSYHNLTTYDGWDVMIGELRSLWTEFCTAVGKGLLAEVKVRNINNINLPLPLNQGFREYITLAPQIPPGINPNLNGFFIQIQTSNPSKNLQAIITEALLGIDNSHKVVNLLLDITVFKKGVFNCNEEEMWNAFNELREYKDALFFSTITPKTEQQFN